MVASTGDKYFVCLMKCLLRLKLLIKELGSPETDGKFVVGLRNGEGPATSRMQFLQLTLTTISNTLIMLDFIQRNEMLKIKHDIFDG